MLKVVSRRRARAQALHLLGRIATRQFSEWVCRCCRPFRSLPSAKSRVARGTAARLHANVLLVAVLGMVHFVDQLVRAPPVGLALGSA